MTKLEIIPCSEKVVFNMFHCHSQWDKDQHKSISEKYNSVSFSNIATVRFIMPMLAFDFFFELLQNGKGGLSLIILTYLKCFIPVMVFVKESLEIELT